MTPHKHADLIKAWADGAEVEWHDPDIGWQDVGDHPSWAQGLTYRIKPETKPNVVTWHSVHPMDIDGSFGNREDAKGTYATKAILRIEIDHNDPDNPVLVSATLEKP